MSVADDHAIVPKQSIEQTRFACVCGSVNHNAHALTENATLIGRSEKRRNFLTSSIEPGAQHLAVIGRNAFLGKIN